MNQKWRKIGKSSWQFEAQKNLFMSTGNQNQIQTYLQLVSEKKAADTNKNLIPTTKNFDQLIDKYNLNDLEMKVVEDDEPIKNLTFPLKQSSQKQQQNTDKYFSANKITLFDFSNDYQNQSFSVANLPLSPSTKIKEILELVHDIKGIKQNLIQYLENKILKYKLFYQKSIHELKQFFEHYQKQCNNLVTYPEQIKITKLQQQLDKTNNQLEQQKKNKQFMHLQCENLITKNKQLKTIIKTKSEEVAQLGQKVSQHLSKVQKGFQSTKNDQLLSLLQQKDHQISQINRQNSILQELIFDMQQKMVGIDLQIENQANKKIKQLQRNLKKQINSQQYQNRIKILNIEIKTLQNKFQFYKQDIQKKQKQYQNKYEEIYKNQFSIQQNLNLIRLEKQQLETLKQEINLIKQNIQLEKIKLEDQKNILEKKQKNLNNIGRSKELINSNQKQQFYLKNQNQPYYGKGNLKSPTGMMDFEGGSFRASHDCYYETSQVIPPNNRFNKQSQNVIYSSSHHLPQNLYRSAQTSHNSMFKPSLYHNKNMPYRHHERHHENNQQLMPYSYQISSCEPWYGNRKYNGSRQQQNWKSSSFSKDNIKLDTPFSYDKQNYKDRNKQSQGKISKGFMNSNYISKKIRQKRVQDNIQTNGLSSKLERLREQIKKQIESIH